MFVVVEVEGNKTPIIKFKQYLTCVAYGLYVGEVSERVLESLTKELEGVGQEGFGPLERVVLVTKYSTQINGFRIQTFGNPRTVVAQMDGIAMRYIPDIKR